ncbi:MAG: NAD-dependent epimerase/dehydratase family protein [Myxococcota bacterium]
MDTSQTLVCVTGASGFIGTHVVRALRTRGYSVRATVRDPRDRSKVDHLRALGDVDIVPGDLMRPGSFDAALKDCAYVVHTASPVLMTARDPERDIVQPAIQGTRNILESVVKARTVRRVVVTSSIAAVYNLRRPPAYVFTEGDWNEAALKEALPYPKSKVLAERAALQFKDSLPAREQFELTVINPTFVLGPVDAEIHLRTSPDLIRTIMNKKISLAPDFFFNFVDVRDVAEAHVRAMVVPAEQLEARYICYADQLHMDDVCNLLADAFPERFRGRWRVPNPLVYAYAAFDRRLTWAYLRQSLGRRIHIDNRRARQSLGLAFRSVNETIVDTARSMVELGLVR